MAAKLHNLAGVAAVWLYLDLPRCPGNSRVMVQTPRVSYRCFLNGIIIPDKTHNLLYDPLSKHPTKRQRHARPRSKKTLNPQPGTRTKSGRNLAPLDSPKIP